MSDWNWTRSSFAEGLSLEVSRDGSDTVLVRDGKVEAWNALVESWSVDEWRELLAALKQGEDHKDILLAPEGAWFGHLWFVGDEWNAFVKGVKAGEFDVEKLSSPVPVSEGSQVSGEVGPADERPNLAATGTGAAAVPPVPVAAQQEISDETDCPHLADILAGRATGIHDDSTCGWCAVMRSSTAPVPVPVVAQPADQQIATIKSHFTRRVDTLKARAERAERERDEAVATQPRYVLDAPAILDMVGRYAEACVEAATTGSPKGREDAREQIRDLWDAIRAALTPVPDVEPEPRWGSGPLVDHNPETTGTGSAYPAKYGYCAQCGAEPGQSCHYMFGDGTANQEPNSVRPEPHFYRDSPDDDPNWRNLSAYKGSGTGSADPDGGQR